MKLRKSYVLFINDALHHAFFGGAKFDTRIHQHTSRGNDLVGCRVFDCNTTQLKHNISILQKQGYRTGAMKY